MDVQMTTAEFFVSVLQSSLKARVCGRASVLLCCRYVTFWHLPLKPELIPQIHFFDQLVGQNFVGMA